MRLLVLACCLASCFVPASPAQTASPEPGPVRVARAVSAKVHMVIAIAMPVWVAFVDNKVSGCRSLGHTDEQEAIACLGLAAHTDVVRRNMEVLVAAQEVLVGLLGERDADPAQIGAAYISVGESLRPLIEPFRMAMACQDVCEEVALAYNL